VVLNRTVFRRFEPWVGGACAVTNAVLVLSSILWMAQPVSAQDSSDNHDSQTFRVTVINKVTREPIERALVSSSDGRVGGMTDTDGHFELKPVNDKNAAVNAGRIPGVNLSSGGATWFESFGTLYALAARKPGFLQDPNGADHATQGNEVTIALFPEAIIRGRVLITNAEPAVGMNVQLFMRQVQDGMPRWQGVSMTRTNSLGEFRFAELLPGSYKVMTEELLDTDPETVAPRSKPYGFPPKCFPGVPDFARGSTIQLTAGQMFQADIPLAREPYFQVSIPVVNAEKIQGMNVKVLAEAHPGPGYSLGYNLGTRRIEGLLPSGHYLVEGHTYGPVEASGVVSIVVANAAAEQASMVLALGIQIPVNVREDFASNDWNGGASMSVDGRNYVLKGPRVYLNVSLEPVDEFSQPGFHGPRPPTAPNDESIVLDNVPPGRYWVRAGTGRGYVQSLSSSGVDLLREPLVVTSGSSTPIEVFLRDDTAGIEGKVAGASAAQSSAGLSDAGQAIRQSPSAYIYCIPSPDSAGQFRELPVSPDGTFDWIGLPPGSYRILAFAHPHPNLPYRDPQGMRAYENQGQVVRLVPGQKEHLQLQLSSGE
jgi:hypothetical protein